MSAQLFSMLDDEVQAREWTEEQQELDEFTRLYEGELPARFKNFFPKASPEMLIQVIALAHDDLATQAGRLPDLRGEPRDMTQRELKAVGLLEKIAYYYLRFAKPTGKVFMKTLAWWLQLGRAVAIVTPDFEMKMPRFQIRDPRYCYPGIAETSGNAIVELNDLIFKYEMDIDEARSRGLANPENPNSRERARSTIEIIEYIDKEKWVFVSEDGNAKTAEHNLGVVPGHVFQSFTPNKKAGNNRFRDQLTLQVGISRLISAKLAFADRVTSSTLWTRNYEGMVEIGPDTIIRLGPQGEIGQIGPPQTLQVDKDIQMLNQFSRVLNKNPEVRQGEIAAKGTYTSAKTLEQLDAAIDTVVGGDWDIIGPGMEKLFRAAFAMDVTLWPNEEKTITGDVRGKRFLDTYVPSKDIGDRRYIRVDYGFGLGGYQGFLQHLQAHDAGVMPKENVIEAMPGISDVAEAMRKMELEAVTDAAKASIQQQAATGVLDLRLIAKISKKMAEKGMPLLEAVQEMEEELAEQAEAAAATEQGALTAPLPEELPQEPELPGIPPAVLAGV